MRSTHVLDRAEGATCQDVERKRQSKGNPLSGDIRGGICQSTERKRSSEGNSLSGDGRGKDLSGHGKKGAKRWALTLWRQQRERLVRTQNEGDRVRGTHILEIAEGDLFRIPKESDQARRGNSLSEDRRRRDFVRTQKQND